MTRLHAPMASFSSYHTGIPESDPFFHRYFQQSACLSAWFDTTVDVDVIGTPEIIWMGQ